MLVEPFDSLNKVVGVDTNILINFGSFKRLPWRKLFPDATSITVLVCAKVQSEMDRHKDHGAGYVRKRAKEFQKVLRSAEGDGYEVSLDDGDIPVRCVFLDRPQNSVLDGTQFDLTDADELIVAQYHHASKTWGQLTIIANDASPIRAAKRALMSALRPDSWTADRTEPEDEVTRSLRERTRELERIVGAMPKVELREISVRGGGSSTLVFAQDFDYAKFQAEMRARLADRVKLPTRMDLVKQFGRRDAGSPFMPEPLWGGIGETELYAWESEVNAFQAHFDRVSETQMLKQLTMLRLVYLVEVTIKNDGEAPDRNICVDMEIRGNARFIDPTSVEKFNDWKLRKPKPPSLQRWSMASLADLVSADRKDEYSFHRTQRTEAIQSHRCSVLMQGKAATVYAYVLAKDVGRQPSVFVTITAQHLPSPIGREVSLVPQPITLNWASLRELILDRLRLMPDGQADVLRVTLDDR
ncbi:hypothetical protein RsS62_28140 [Rhizobium dioscoreae]|nr:hypothetical protein RsS62_28140 [Rhizobium dioscoreae]